MTRPGDRLRQAAMHLCGDRTRRRLIDPAIADLQAEAAAARRAGSTWRTLRVLVAGYLAVLKVLFIGACVELRVRAGTWERGESARARRGVWIAAGIIGVATAALEFPMLHSMSHNQGLAERIRLGAYLVPSTLALTVPLGLAVATAWVLHGAGRRPRVAGVALAGAALASVLMFANLAWLTPDANQAFRERVMAQYGTDAPAPIRGDGELRFGELRNRLQLARDAANSDDIRHLEILYYRKLSCSVAPAAMVALMVALAFRRPWSRLTLTALACGVYVAYYAFLISAFPLAERGVAQPIVLEWAINALFTGAAVALTWRRRPA